MRSTLGRRPRRQAGCLHHKGHSLFPPGPEAGCRSRLDGLGLAPLAALAVTVFTDESSLQTAAGSVPSPSPLPLPLPDSEGLWRSRRRGWLEPRSRSGSGSVTTTVTGWVAGWTRLDGLGRAPLEVRPESPLVARIARRCEMWRRKAAVVVPLLQGLAAPQIGTRSGTSVPEWASPHSRFSAV